MRKIQCIILAILLCAMHVHAQMAVFDPTNWLTAISELYATYDQIMNTVQQLKTQYQQLQHAYEMAKTWDFSKVKWDGDWDFRNEISNAGAAVNRQLTQLRNLTGVLHAQNIRLGGMSYSIADLVGAGDANKNILRFVEHGAEWMSNEQMSRAVRGFTGKMTEKEKRAIWQKYGISPDNFVFVKETNKFLKKQADRVLAAGLDENTHELIESTTKKYGDVFAAAMSGKNPTEILQQIAAMIKLIGEQINTLNTNLSQIGTLYALQVEREKTQQDIARDTANTITKAQKRGTPSSMFVITSEEK